MNNDPRAFVLRTAVGINTNMRLSAPHLHNVFSDKSSLVIRALLREPKRRWQAVDLRQEGVSFGQATIVLDTLEEAGFVRRHAKARNSYSEVTDALGLLKNWGQNYKFSWNRFARYHTTNKNIEQDVRSHLQKNKVQYTMTLYSASRRVAPYVTDFGTYFYLNLNPNEMEDVLRVLEAQFSLLHLKNGGELTFALPFYKSSVFRDSYKIDDTPVVSNLQLYLDLLNYPPAGAEEAGWLEERLRERGTPLVDV